MNQYLVTVTRRAEVAPQKLYLLETTTPDAINRLVAALLYDPVVEIAHWHALADLPNPAATLVPGQVAGPASADIAYKPGVTDNEAESLKLGAARLGLPLQAARTLRRVWLSASGDAASHYNPLVETCWLEATSAPDPAARHAFYQALLRPPAEVAPRISRVPLRHASDDELLRISRAGILALDLTEMQAIQAYFRDEGRDPTDGELETLAQTWSEHCSHKTFKARVRYQCHSQSDLGPATFDHTRYPLLHQLEHPLTEIDSLIKTFLMAATQQVLAGRQSAATDPRSLTPDPWVLSAFVDNAGIVAFGAAHEVSFKVETHNHPSALEPFGGANTGVGGVVRDVLGVSAQPIANTDVLCFGMPDLPAAQLADGMLHPRSVAAGVVAGVRDYGNKLGIPTVNGAVLYDHGYTANPLVFCGTVGLAPRGGHPRRVQAGDAVVVLGGRTGRDGIHGATFSSEELTHTTAAEVGSAVQIGDPITEKQLIDVILQARDQGLYSAITDCGAGGLSSAVGEMGAELGVTVALETVPLKYPGLQPWEIWLSEAQERMVLAVPPTRLAHLLDLCAAEDLEASVIGSFDSHGRLHVSYRGTPLVDLAMDFLHNGRPQRLLAAAWTTEDGRQETGDRRQPANTPHMSLVSCLLSLLAHPNIASKAPIVRSYDHEVGGRTVIKPLVGEDCAGPGDAAVLQPLPDSVEGLALGCGINPRYGQFDPYWMALACVDEALRNVVAVGGDPQRTAILDNFCWGDPRQPDRLAGLVRAAAGCHDAALAYGTPFISGKDSLNNEYRAADGSRTPIPPTLLISAMAHVPDIHQTVTSDLKTPGNLLYLVGLTKDELGGAHILDCGMPRLAAGANEVIQSPHPLSQYPVRRVPQVDLATAPKLLAAVHRAIRQGLVRACHDLSEGGLAVAAAEMALAGGLGLALDLRLVPHAADVALDEHVLFSESPTRLLLEVQPADQAALETILAGLPHAALGQVLAEPVLVISGRSGGEVVRAPIAELSAAWHTQPWQI